MRWLLDQTCARRAIVLIALLVASAILARATHAQTIQLKDGRQLKGKYGEVSSLTDTAQAAAAAGAKQIAFVDNGLTRVFIPQQRIGRVVETERVEPDSVLGIEHRVADNGKHVLRIGPPARITPFDKYGRRIFSMITDKGQLDIIQGITRITPVYCKVESLITNNPAQIVHDMRISTHSIPIEDLKTIIMHRIDTNNVERRKVIVRLLLQMDRLEEAEKELANIVADFPEEKDLAPQVQAMRQLYARKVIDEIKQRKKAGQHALAYTMLEQFPAENVAGEILEQVREMLEDYNAIIKKAEQLQVDLAAFAAKIEDPGRRALAEGVLKEIKEQLSIGTIDRMAAFFQLKDDDTLGADQKVALAISGWLLGSNNAQTNLAFMLAVAKTRDLVAACLVESLPMKRADLLAQIKGMEGASADSITQLLANLVPPWPAPPASVGQPGFYTQTVPIGMQGEADVTYHMQVPPQCDLHGRYPLIITLNGQVSTPQLQIDWWAGAMGDNGMRMGQATRQGYMVMAVDWQKGGQQEYEFSAREHAAVLASLRDACRRFPIDTDRVFISGHSMGADAAWDIALAHPDLWAGVIPIGAQAEKYTLLYWQNARLLPFYVLGGDMDGDRMSENAKTLDRYMTNRFDVTVTLYQGRGHEDFYEDILNIFDWLNHREPRNFYPKTVSVKTMRSWDSYFYWLEMDELPERTIVDPVDWPAPPGVTPLQLEGKIQNKNTLIAPSKSTVWLSPEMVDFSQPVQIRFSGGATRNKRVEPDLAELLEDVRRRGDRQHPFWAKVK